MTVRNENGVLEDLPDQWFFDFFNKEGCFERGNYASNLENWLAYFPAKQLMVIDYKCLAEKPVFLLEQVAAHLSVSSGFFSSLGAGEVSERIFAGIPVPVPERFRAFLLQQYEAPQERFRVLMSELETRGVQIVAGCPYHLGKSINSLKV